MADDELENILFNSQNDYFAYFNRYKDGKITYDKCLDKLVARRKKAKADLEAEFAKRIKAELEQVYDNINTGNVYLALGKVKERIKSIGGDDE